MTAGRSRANRTERRVSPLRGASAGRQRPTPPPTAFSTASERSTPSLSLSARNRDKPKLIPARALCRLASKPRLPGLAAGGVALPAPREARTYTKPCA